MFRHSISIFSLIIIKTLFRAKPKIPIALLFRQQKFSFGLEYILPL